MVEDSIAEKFSSSAVSVAGVNIWNSSDSLIKSFIDETGIAFPIVKRGSSVGNSYSVVANSIVVIDKDGVVRFVQQLGTASTTYAIMRKMVSDAAATVCGLLANSVLTSKTAMYTGRSGTITPRYYTLSGRAIAGPLSLVRAGIVLRRLNGRITPIQVR